MDNKICFIFFILILSFQLILIPPLFAYRNFFDTSKNTFIDKNENIEIFTIYLINIFSDHNNLLKSHGINLDYSGAYTKLDEIKNIFQDNQSSNNIINNLLNFISPFTSNPFLGAISGGIAGPIVGALLGGGIALALDAGISLIEIMVVAFSGAIIFGIIGALLGFIPGFILLGLISAVLGAIFFGIISAISGGVLGVMTLIFAIIAVPLLFIAGGIFGVVVGGIGSGIVNALIGGPVGSLIGIVVVGALGLALGSIVGMGFALVEQLLFIPIVLLVAAIGAVLGFFAGVPAGVIVSFFTPEEEPQPGETNEEQEGTTITQPVPSRVGIPPNIDNLTPTSPVLPPLNYSPYTTRAKLLTFLTKTEEIFYSNDKEIFIYLKETLEPVFDNYNNIFGKSITKNITDKIYNILNKADLTTPEGINKATEKILYLIPATQNNF